MILFSGYLVENLQFPEIISTIEQLNLLQLQSFGNVSQTYIKRLAASLRNLQEICFTTVDMAQSFKNFIIPFCQNPKLKQIVIFSVNIMYRCSRNDMIDIHKVRAPFKADGKLIIYMEKEVINTMDFRMLDESFVILKPLSEFKREVHSFDF